VSSGVKVTRFRQRNAHFLGVFAITASAAAMSQPAAPPSSVWDRVYTAAQAARGAERYAGHCETCHGDDLTGREGRSLIGSQFWTSWGEDNLGSLFGYMKTAMPHGNPGALTDAQYLEIVAFILQKNEYPSGGTELTEGRLSGIRVMRRDGPGPVPNFALVAVTGCLREASPGQWTLANATDPVRTRNPGPAPEAELQRPVSAGANSFQLMDVYQLRDSDRGRSVAVKGLLIRGTPDRLNVTSVQTIGGGCTN
jgi:mono/diheme cytochrome c family protein